MRLRRLITVDKNKLVKRRVVCIQLCIGKGILADRVTIPVRDGAKIDMYTCRVGYLPIGVNPNVCCVIMH